LLARHLRGKPDDDAATHREKGYADYKARLEGAWRSPAAAAERNEAQLEAWRRPGASPGLRPNQAARRAVVGVAAGDAVPIMRRVFGGV
jgi:hypothetical protein